jgi:hypothetical protein
VCSEHLLLGLLCEEQGTAAQILVDLGVRLEDLRDEVLGLLGGPPTRGRIVAFADLPLSVRQEIADLDTRIEQLNHEKDAAIVEQDFEKCAHLRDLDVSLKARRNAVLDGWHTRFAVDAAWLRWNSGAVARIAGVIAEEKRWQDLPVLGDALEEAGCSDQEILGHCRAPGQHTRRCWVVDLLRGQL